MTLLFAILVATLSQCSWGLVLNFRIQEEQAINTFVGSLSNSQQMGAYTVLSYAKLQSEEDGSSLFDVNRATGQIKQAQPIDRENICPTSTRPTQSNFGAKVNRDGDCYVEFSVNALGDGNKLIQALTVHVVIDDIDDNGCIFEPKTQREEIEENALADTTRIKINMPKDPDSSRLGNGVELDNIRLVENDYFALSKDLLRHGKNHQLYLVLKRPLDYEKEQAIRLRVEAGTGSKACQLLVEIVVKDMNDIVPKFRQDEYRLQIPESSVLDSEVLQVQADDGDSGENGRIIYELDANSYTNAAAYFSVESHSGRILLRRALNHKEIQKFDFMITARNPGTGRSTKSATTRVVLEVQDINDHAPTIRVSSIDGSTVLSVREESSFPQDIGLVTITDEDSAENGRIRCQLGTVSPPRVINLVPLVNDGTQMKLVVTASIDREVNSYIDVTINCEDFGNPKQTSSKFTRINVEDINDNGPQFKQSVYNVKVLEDNAPERAMQNFTLLELKATDRDSGQNAKLIYSIVDTPADVMNFIYIEPETGVIRSHGNLDRERFSDLTFQVQVRDQSEDPKFAEATINLHVLDYNDNSPQFDRLGETYDFVVTENAPKDYLVGRVRVQDLDLGDNAEVKIVFDEVTDPSNHIMYASNSPNSIVRSFENQISRISWPKPASYYFYLSSEKLPHQNWTLVSIRTRGHPHTLDREALYHTQGSSRTDFSSSLAESTLATDPVMEFKLIARDQGNPSRQSYATLRIKVQDQNDNDPRWNFHNKETSRVPSVNVSSREAVGFAFSKVSNQNVTI
ncbi:putative calcium-dependent cell-adhesion protein [Cichlidogyrus casuarinus]|uniref:Calcium-dependent cell-adhesion protein n=1 Tax=Cichlidogyrus casuarinus TaxID=1844966 RepID=A0ABD2Q650_9PLAT